MRVYPGWSRDSSLACRGHLGTSGEGGGGGGGGGGSLTSGSVMLEPT